MNLDELIKDELFRHVYSYDTTGHWVDLHTPAGFDTQYMLASNHPVLRSYNGRIMHPDLLPGLVQPLGFMLWQPDRSNLVILHINLLDLALRRWMDSSGAGDPDRLVANRVLIDLHTIRLSMAEAYTAGLLANLAAEMNIHETDLFYWLTWLPDAVKFLLKEPLPLDQRQTLGMGNLMTIRSYAEHALYYISNQGPALLAKVGLFASRLLSEIAPNVAPNVAEWNRLQFAQVQNERTHDPTARGPLAPDLGSIWNRVMEPVLKDAPQVEIPTVAAPWLDVEALINSARALPSPTPAPEIFTELPNTTGRPRDGASLDAPEE